MAENDPTAQTNNTPTASPPARQPAPADETKGNAGASGLVQPPSAVSPGTIGANAIDKAEQARKDAEETAHLEANDQLPEATVNELNAGRDALKKGMARSDWEKSNKTGE